MKTVQVGYLCAEFGAGCMVSRLMWILMTEVLPCPDRWCVGDTPC
ncbi:MAG: hypothetical protein NZ741_05235 [Armatimonadetes bacterium]|nr:hypothetical protein [Armatimonadota bacterium]